MDVSNKKLKNIPIRTCIGTGKKLPKIELLRIISKDNKTLEYDLSGKKSGRGANISLSIEALELAIKKRAFDRAFKRKINDDEISYLRDNFEAMVDQKKFRSLPHKKVTVRINKAEFERL